MFRYARRRLWQMIPILLGVSLGAFAFNHAIPGDPARLLAGPDASAADVAAVRAQLGLNQPLPVQYLYFLKNALAGNFGRSYRSREPVTQVLGKHFGPTLILSLAGIVIATIAGLGVGTLQAVRRNSLADYASTVISVAGISTPAFFLGLLLIFLFSVDVHWFPTGGMSDARSLVLPAVTLAAASAAQIARFARSSLLDVVGEDYVRTARAKGVAERRVLVKHSLRNALIPVVTVIGLQFGILQAVRRNSLADYTSTVISVAGISTPAFFLGLLLIFLFSVDVHWFPTGGMSDARSLVLPAVTLAAASAAQIARFARSSLLDVVGEDYVRTARAKGVGERRVLVKHSLRNALIPVVTVIGLQFGILLGGSIVVETVFTWPGLGWLLIQSISFRDYPILTAEILLFSLEFLAINLIVDLLYAALDPRVAYA